MVWLSNMADTFLEKCTRCAKVCGLLFLDCAFGMLIGWARKSRSHGTEREFVFLHFSTFVWIENDGESVKPIQTSPNERLLQTLWDFTDRDWQSWIQTRTATTFAFCWNPRFYLVSKQTFCCLSQETHRERARCGGNWESNVWRARDDQTSGHRVHV